MKKSEDTNYQDHVIKEVKDDKNYYAITVADGFSVGLNKKNCLRVIPHIGDTMRLYGDGLGSIIRGMDINGRECFYKTPEEQQVWNKKEVERLDREKKREYETEEKTDLDKQYAALPELFKRRIDKFRGNNPDFRWKYESYEMFVCTEAIKIVDALKTSEEIKRFMDLPYNKQKQLVNFSDQHSGNTMGAAIALAFIYVTQPEGVVRLHGALAPLVGSKEYGCVPRDGGENNENA